MVYRGRIKYRRKKQIYENKKIGKGLEDLLSYLGKSYWQAVKWGKEKWTMLWENSIRQKE